MSLLLSIDPGTHHYGLALWNDGVLERAWWIKKSDPDYGSWRTTDEVVCEHPQVYMNNLKVANDMIGLALSAGELVGRIGVKVTYYRPSTWKGQIKKEAHHPLIRAALSIDELKRVDLTKNKKNNEDIWDAVGIGLYHLGRIERGKRAGRGR